MEEGEDWRGEGKGIIANVNYAIWLSSFVSPRDWLMNNGRRHTQAEASSSSVLR